MDEALAALAPDAGDDAALASIESVLAALAAVSPRSPLQPSQRRLREDQVLGRLSRRFGLSREALRGRMLELRDRARPDTAEAAPVARPLPRLPAWDREVIEVLVGVPDSAGLIVRQVGTAGLESREARAVLQVAERLHGQGRSVALSDLLLEIEDPTLQSLLVAADESSASRGTIDPHERIHHLEDALRRRSAERQAHASARSLKTSRLDSRSEAELLERLVAERRAAQGMTDPKDG
jgi:hypothetical protein